MVTAAPAITNGEERMPVVAEVGAGERQEGEGEAEGEGKVKLLPWMA